MNVAHEPSLEKSSYHFSEKNSRDRFAKNCENISDNAQIAMHNLKHMYDWQILVSNEISKL